MSEYVSDTPQERYKCVAYVKRTIDVCLGHVTEASRKRPTQGLGKSERASSVHDVSKTFAERARNVFDVLVTHVKFISDVWGIRPSSWKHFMHA